MKSNIAFFKCEICGNIVELVKNGKGVLVCCGKPMVKLDPNTVDASQEKHVPVAVRRDGKIYVEVGSVEHPMTNEHLIEWILVVDDSGLERIHLSSSDSPKAAFCDRENADVYAYCNLHGLWKSDVK